MNGKRKGLGLNKFKGCEYDLTREVLKLLSFFLVYLFTIIIIEWKNMYHLILKKGKQNIKKPKLSKPNRISNDFQKGKQFAN